MSTQDTGRSIASIVDFNWPVTIPVVSWTEPTVEVLAQVSDEYHYPPPRQRRHQWHLPRVGEVEHWFPYILEDFAHLHNEIIISRALYECRINEDNTQALGDHFDF